jgi:hypothetical protein
MVAPYEATEFIWEDFEGRSANTLGGVSFDQALMFAVEKAKEGLNHPGPFVWRLKSVEGFGGSYNWDATVIVRIEAGVRKNVPAAPANDRRVGVDRRNGS